MVCIFIELGEKILMEISFFLIEKGGFHQKEVTNNNTGQQQIFLKWSRGTKHLSYLI